MGRDFFLSRKDLEGRLEIIRNRKAMYKLRIRRLEKEEIKILEDLGVFKKEEEGMVE